MSEPLVALRMTVATLALTGLVYPLAMTAVARVLFPHPSRGSLVHDGQGRMVGSALIAQPFHRPGYFQPRPSAAGADGYDGAGSSGSNLGPTSARLRARVAAEVARLQAANPAAPRLVPADLVTTSASGLDPHLSPEAVSWQVPRVAAARGVAPDRVQELADRHLEPRTLGFLGEPRVNVLLLNLALDEHLPQ